MSERLSGTTSAGVRWISYSLPLRPDFMATLDLPRDLSSAEAERIAAFVRTLAIPSDSEHSNA
jgi:hypothetical protein